MLNLVIVLSIILWITIGISSYAIASAIEDKRVHTSNLVLAGIFGLVTTLKMLYYFVRKPKVGL